MSINFLGHSTFSFWKPTDFSANSTEDKALYFAPVISAEGPLKQVKLQQFFSGDNAMVQKLDGKKTAAIIASQMASIGVETFAFRLPKIDSCLGDALPSHVYVKQDEYLSRIADRCCMVLGSGVSDKKPDFTTYENIMANYTRLNPALIPSNEIHRICMIALTILLYRDLTPNELEGLKELDAGETLSERFFKYMIDKATHPLFQNTNSSYWLEVEFESGDLPQMAKQVDETTLEILSKTLLDAEIPCSTFQYGGASYISIALTDYAQYIEPYVNA